MITPTVTFYPSAPLQNMDVDLERRFKTKINDVYKYKNLIINIWEKITHAEDENHNPEKKKKFKTLTSI